jgi:kynurenine formamidase
MIARSSLRVVELAQTLSPETAVWPGVHPLSARTTNTYADGGSFAREVTFHEHTGTHFDAPAHFHEGGRTVEAIPAADLVCDIAMIDIRSSCAGDPDYGLSIADIEDHETEHGLLPAGIAVLVCTGWSELRGDPARYVGDMHFPGLSLEAGHLLVERGVAGIGIDTLSIDRGVASDCPVHFVTLPAGLWQLEGLVHLEQLPPRGALLVAGPLRLVGGSGTPARPIALLPA